MTLTRLWRAPDSRSAFWVYALRAAQRDRTIAALHAAGIGAQRLHLRNARDSCFAGTAVALPGVDAFDAENLCVPCGWWVDAEARARILKTLRAG